MFDHNFEDKIILICITGIAHNHTHIEGVKLCFLLPFSRGATFFRALSATFCVTTSHDDKIIQRKCNKNLQVCEPTANTEHYDVLKSDIYQCTLHNTLQQDTGSALCLSILISQLFLWISILFDLKTAVLCSLP